MLLEGLFPTLPSGPQQLFIVLSAGLCIILLVYSVFIEKEHRQDLIRLLGTGGLFWYALYINNFVFALAMGALGLASLIEFLEIMFGLHTHSPEDLQQYKTLWRIKFPKKKQ
ncbi:MAG: hypothetical protein A3J66_04305 [Candidatus Magasanikbacteria bacterium RIFCSPHIGHO2_02_FULL_47_14]|uniref:Uncharacterized protein n=1 Tax=Candidatus Magasanikbacteria bacterium RIFCSPHIGHO2_02_FULL_47_14 TaxID=1798680 RepID=A0A1F6M4I7_9BACT|nr:MAG: hypothetical protein A3J66_04305 [Candidatus Magasanikbacteria bacterium RIFCSPHIGHO2_02_FULL_47_14]